MRLPHERKRGCRTEGEFARVVARNPIPVLILVAVLVGLGAAYAYFQTTEGTHYAATRKVAAQRSEIRLGMTVTYDHGPLVQERYELSDIEGTSRSSYRALGRGGTQITITERPRVTLEDGANVAFFFDKVVRDGIWELRTKPPRGDTRERFAISIAQLTGEQHGSHRFAFTDPHYWATTGGHQFHIKLAKDKPIPNLLQLSSTTLVEPRYQELVDDFRSFGPSSFRAKVAAAQARLGARS